MLPDSKLNQLLKCKLKSRPWAWTLTCIKLDSEKRLFLRHIYKLIWMSSSKLRWTVNSSKVLMNNIKLNSLETSSTLLNADSKIAEALFKQKLKLTPKKHPNNQLLKKPTKERKLKILKTGHLVLEMPFQLSAIKTDSQNHPKEL